jgi:hypothetical protein
VIGKQTSGRESSDSRPFSIFFSHLTDPSQNLAGSFHNQSQLEVLAP